MPALLRFPSAGRRASDSNSDGGAVCARGSRLLYTVLNSAVRHAIRRRTLAPGSLPWATDDLLGVSALNNVRARYGPHDTKAGVAVSCSVRGTDREAYNRTVTYPRRTSQLGVCQAIQRCFLVCACTLKSVVRPMTQHHTLRGAGSHCLRTGPAPRS